MLLFVFFYNFITKNIICQYYKYDFLSKNDIYYTYSNNLEVAVFDTGSRITELREKKGITVNKLANLAGISQSHLRAIEMGTKQPTVICLEYICYALELTLTEFFDVENKKSGDIETVLNHLNDAQRKALADFLKTL